MNRIFSLLVVFLKLFLVLIMVCSIGPILAQSIIIHPYLQDLAQDKVTIMWETDDEIDGSVLYGTDPFSLNQSIASTTIVGNGTSRIHAAILSSLQESTKYYYKVTLTNGVQSQLKTFRTLQLSSEEQNTQFIAISDMQRDGSKPDKFREIIEEGIVPTVFSEIGDSLYDLEAILIPGDLVVTGGTYSQWQNHFFSKADSITPNVPLYPVPGNHEYFGGGLPNFLKYFTLPDNGPTALEEQCWYKDISNVRIIGLNSNSNSSDKNTQLNWLSELLDSTCMNSTIDFVFAELHHPYKSELWTPGESSFTGSVVDSLESFTTDCKKASIHFFGHTHGYSRGQSRDHKHLWVNVATAGGAIDNWGEFPNADYAEFVKSQDEYGFVYIDVVAGEDPTFTLRRYSRGDQDLIQENILRDEITILNNDIKPSTPIALFPNGDTLPPNCLQLKASEFYGVDDSHQASHWQITDESDFSSVLTEKWAQNENFYNEINTQEDDDLTDESFDNLSSTDSLFWRVRYRNQNLEWSNWSEPAYFFTQGNIDTLSSNLVVNGDAENGIQNWIGDIESLESGECNSVSPFEGTHNFAVGGICQNESPLGIATQTIDLTSFQNEIDSDSLKFAFSAYMRDFSGSDVPEIYVDLYNKDSIVVTSDVLSNATSTWIKKGGIVAVPEGIDSCIVVLKGIRNGGTDNDSYFDLIEAYLIDVDDCIPCYGTSGIDSDNDGFCDDLDCQDTNSAIYPGAIELCNGIDDDCDGKADLGNTVIWSGNGGSNVWSNPMNWNQELVPLPCQHVIINDFSSVIVDGIYECASLEIDSGSQLDVVENSTLIINSQNNNSIPSARIYGSMFINGRCDLKNSSGLGFDVYGVLKNYNKLNLFDVNLDRIRLRPGSRFDSLGKTVLK
ncbi:MAG: metallophosphoesterase [Saprospiraceae bacterium]|nr:metallophosphoesterase [Saprospiraceae bacterium]